MRLKTCISTFEIYGEALMELKRKFALVAGAGCIAPEEVGNGKATAILFAREGATVVCADINKEAADITCALIRNEGYRATSVRMDMMRRGRGCGCRSTHQGGTWSH